MRWRRSSRRWRTLCLPRDIRQSRWRLWAARSTDREDHEKVAAAMAALTADGLYPEKLK